VVGVCGVVVGVRLVVLGGLWGLGVVAGVGWAAQLTGRPSALASALVKVSGGVARIPTEDLRTAQSFNAFFFTPAFKEGTVMATLFSTHPTLERRLEALAEITEELDRRG
jgi:heat shock protein HtpX